MSRNVAYRPTLDGRQGAASPPHANAPVGLRDAPNAKRRPAHPVRIRPGEHRMTPFPAPYVFPDSRLCPGHLVKIEAFNADLSWVFGESGGWTFKHSQPRSRYQLFCSERGDHAGDSLPEQMKCYLSGMSDDLLAKRRA